MYEPFTLPGRTRFFAGPGQLPQCELTGPGGRARIALQGAQVLAYEPSGQSDLLWLSPRARFEPGRAIRGGIPVCWPWFGDHPEDRALPAHGFARTALWQVRSSFAGDDTTQLTLGLSDSGASRALWPAAFELELTIELGDALHLSLTTRNTGAHSIQVSEALHSYIAVGDLQQVRLEGLGDCRYHDKLDAFAIRHQEDDSLCPVPPLDRVYDGPHGSELRLYDPVLERVIHLTRRSADSVIVWNPGPDAAAAMADIGSGNSARFLCVEAGNALDSSIRLMPDESHTLEMWLSSTPLPVALAPPSGAGESAQR